MTNEFELNQPHIVRARSIGQLSGQCFFCLCGVWWCLVVSGGVWWCLPSILVDVSFKINDEFRNLILTNKIPLLVTYSIAFTFPSPLPTVKTSLA